VAIIKKKHILEFKLFHVLFHRGKETKTEKMRVALALILLISLATAFKLEKERPVFEDDVEKQDEANGRDEQTDDEGDNEVIVRFTIGSCDI